MKNFKLLLATLCVSTALLVSGCADSTPKEKAKVEKPSIIHSTYVKAPLNIPSIIEKEETIFEKAFKEQGIPFEYSTITEGPKQTAAMASGDIDIAHALGGTSAILAKANGIDLRIVGMYSRAPKAFVIVVKNPDIKSVEDLRGKTVMGPKGTNLHQLLLMALAEKGMKAEDVNFVSSSIPQAAAALENGSADAALMAGPAALKATEQGARVLRDSQGLLNATIVIAVRGAFMDKYPEQVKAFLAAHKDVIKRYNEKPASFFDVTAKETGLTASQVATMSPWYDFDSTVKETDIKDLEKAQSFLIESGILEASKKVDIKAMFQEIK